MSVDNVTLERTRRLFNICESGGDVFQVQALLEQGVDLSAEKENVVEGFVVSENTPLEEAAENGHVAIVQLLKEHGSQIGDALSLAVKKGHLTVVELLIKDLKGSSEDLPNDLGFLLSFAAKEGHLEVAKFLVRSGANINWVDADNYTPIMLAVEEGHGAIVDFLLTLNPSLKGIGATLDELERDLDDNAMFAAAGYDIESEQQMFDTLKKGYADYLVRRQLAEGFTGIRGFFETGKSALQAGELRSSDYGFIPWDLMQNVVSFVVGDEAMADMMAKGKKDFSSSVESDASKTQNSVVSNVSILLPHYMFPTIASLLKDVRMTVEDVARERPSFAQALRESMVSACTNQGRV
jgi:ankyrin repeat protein